MERAVWIAAYRVLFALLGFGAVIFRLVHSLQVDPTFSVANYFSFFTIQSNLFAVVVLLGGALGLASRWQPDTAGREITYVGWADTVVHRIMPIVIVTDWLIAPPRTRLTLRAGLIWLSYPVLFLAYSLIRGPIVAWYPYPFLTPARVGGYAGVALYAVGIALFILLVTWLTVTVGNALGRLRRRAAGLPGQPGTTESPV